MQKQDSVYITPAEWRWVIVVSSGLALLVFLPFLWVAISGVGTQWQFMGVLNNYRDGATYLAKMFQGTQGSWLVRFLHTPEVQNGAFLQIIYPALGHLARLTRISPIALFHAARVVATLMMYMALYHLGATIWTRIRTRRIFFVLIGVGAGFGWLFGTLTGDTRFPDLTIPEMFPLYSSAVNVHFPLTLACLALLASVIVQAFRPGVNMRPNVKNGGLTAALVSLGIAVLYPQALLPFLAAVGMYVLWHWWIARRFYMDELRWGLMVALPVLPVMVYYALILTDNPIIVEWSRQNVTPAPPPLYMLVGLGLPLIIALPGLYRAVRRFEPDGDQIMLLWLIAIVILVYFPTSVQRRFSAGMMIPVAYFATRALEDFWFQRISRPWRYRLAAVVVPFIAVSQVFVLVAPLLPILSGQPDQNNNLFLEQDYRAVFDWMESSNHGRFVVLASPNVSAWLPGWTGGQVVYGHPYETMQAAEREAAVLAWYSGSLSSEDCDSLLHTSQYQVNYVLVGPQERALGTAACADGLRMLARFGSVLVYAP
ncbi:MAG: hypothetical protein H6671_04345 [Anaerolineaceae bacterium]|nr:hypothetical protein [Anaerolineaceae bacterium]